MDDSARTPRPDGHDYPSVPVAPGPRAGTPRAIHLSGDEDFLDLPLTALAGRLPPDLLGHVFVAGPRMKPGRPALSSNGVVYRIDFGPAPSAGAAAGKREAPAARLTSSRVRTASWYIRRAVNDLGYLKRPFVDHRLHQFRAIGLGQFSLTLGAQELPNTDLVVIPGSGRLVVTTDAGRPWQIDPRTLRALSPLGLEREWTAALPLPWMLPLQQTTAHCAVDPQTEDLYTSNHAPDAPPLSRPFTHVCRWSERDPRVRHWRVVDRATGKDISVQTLHQLVVTANHVVLLDSDFPVDLLAATAGLFNPWAPISPELVERLTAPGTSAVATAWVVEKSALIDSAQTLDPASPPTVTAQRCTLGPGGLHLTADFREQGGKIRVVMSHTPSEDLTHVLRTGEPLLNGERVPAHLDGMLTPVPIIRGMIGVHEIDPKTGAVDSRFHSSDAYTWGIAVFTHAGAAPGEPPGAHRTRNVWFNAGGFTRDLLPLELYELYKDRAGSMESLPAHIPASVFRFDTESLEFDGWSLPDGWYAFGPTFVPSSKPGVGREDGYLVVMALSDPSRRLPEGSSGDELWVFDAMDIARGPICRLGHPRLRFGMTLHSIFLRELPPPPMTNRVDMRDDLDIEGIKKRYLDAAGENAPLAVKLLLGPLRAMLRYVIDFDEVERMLVEQVYPYFEPPVSVPSSESTMAADESTAGMPGPGCVPSPTM